MAGLAVVIAMSPILTDEQRPVGRAWPGAEKLPFEFRSKFYFRRRPVTGGSKLSLELPEVAIFQITLP
jgi:hypothetical protein